MKINSTDYGKVPVKFCTCKIVNKRPLEVRTPTKDDKELHKSYIVN